MRSADLGLLTLKPVDSESHGDLQPVGLVRHELIDYATWQEDLQGVGPYGSFRVAPKAIFM